MSDRGDPQAKDKMKKPIQTTADRLYDLLDFVRDRTDLTVAKLQEAATSHAGVPVTVSQVDMAIGESTVMKAGRTLIFGGETYAAFVVALPDGTFGIRYFKPREKV